jgi:hypothetical protein
MLIVFIVFACFRVDLDNITIGIVHNFLPIFLHDFVIEIIVELSLSGFWIVNNFISSCIEFLQATHSVILDLKTFFVKSHNLSLWRFFDSVTIAIIF